MYTENFQRILMETTPEEKAAILREVFEESGIPYVTGQGGFGFPSLFADDGDSEKLVCPYCGAEQECHDPDMITAFVCTEECERCGRVFEYSVSVSRSYSARKMED